MLVTRSFWKENYANYGKNEEKTLFLRRKEHKKRRETSIFLDYLFFYILCVHYSILRLGRSRPNFIFLFFRLLFYTILHSFQG